MSRDSEEITLRGSLLEELQRPAKLRIVCDVATFCCRITECDTRDARAEQAIDFRSTGLELCLVDFYALRNKAIVEFLAQCFRDHEARLYLRLLLDCEIDESGADDLCLRCERVEKLLYELKYEITRGMMEGEIGETLGFRFFVPISKAIPDGVVYCNFETRPSPRYFMGMEDLEPRLKIVKGGEQ